MIRSAIRLVLLTMLVGGGSLEAQGPPGPRPPGGGRPLRVDAQQALDFGELLGGLPQVVPANDPINAGRMQVSGQGGSDVLVSFLLPTALDGPGNAAVPLVFGPGAAGYSATQDIDGQLAFDPSISNVFTLPQNGRGTLYLGGTAIPPAQAVVGSYAATITLTISYVGN
ncbi:MAG: hypothetical protein WD995_05155 [Gemmatimonadota bacterium]